MTRQDEPVKEWEVGELQDALDTLVAQYMEESNGTKRPSNTTAYELIVWNGARVKAQGKAGLSTSRLRELVTWAQALQEEEHYAGVALEELLAEVQRLRRRK